MHNTPPQKKVASLMLFVLTGAIQIGKSRWLEALVRGLTNTKTTCYGVVSAGIWVPSTSEHANDQGFEKLGIESVLLPEGKRFEFAKRNDIAREMGTFDAHNQAAQAKLGWHISEEALVRVNEHFAWISAQRAERAQTTHHTQDATPNLLVVDELGMLELDRGGGFTEAVKLLDQGPCDFLPHALVVARSGLEQKAADRFGETWSGAQFIHPGDAARKIIDTCLHRSA